MEHLGVSAALLALPEKKALVHYLFAHPGVAFSVYAHYDVNCAALSALGTGEAVVRMIRQDEFGYRLAGADHSGGIGLDDHPFGDHSCTFKYVDFPFVRGADGTQLLKVDSEIVIPKFLYEYLLTIQLENAGKYERHYKYLKRVKVPIPSITEQQQAVSEIEAYEQKIAEAKAVMAGCAERKKQILEKWLK